MAAFLAKIQQQTSLFLNAIKTILIKITYFCCYYCGGEERSGTSES